MCLTNQVLPKIAKKSWKVNETLSFWIRQKTALFQRKSALFSTESALFQKKSALKQRWFLALKFFVFSAVQSWTSAVHRFSGNEQRWNRPEVILNQSWSTLNVSETSTRERLSGKGRVSERLSSSNLNGWCYLHIICLLLYGGFFYLTKSYKLWIYQN